MTVTGATLASATARRRVTPEVLALAVGNAATLSAIDVVYVARRRIRAVYLWDAALELGLIVFLVRSRGARRRSM